MTVSFGITGDLKIPGVQGQGEDGNNPVLSSLMTETASSAHDALTMRIDFGSNTAAPDTATEFFNERNKIGIWGIEYVIKLGITFTQDNFSELFDFLIALWDKSEEDALNPNGRFQPIMSADRIKVGKRIGFIRQDVDDEIGYLQNLRESLLTPEGLTCLDALNTYLKTVNCNS